jgi:hypothetical protein
VPTEARKIGSHKWTKTCLYIREEEVRPLQRMYAATLRSHQWHLILWGFAG